MTILNGRTSRELEVGLLLLGTGLRAVFVLGQTWFEWFSIHFVAADSQRYLNLARTLATGEGMTVNGFPSASVTPGYPLFLAGLSLVGVTTPLGVGLVQCAIGGLTCVLVFRITKEFSAVETAVLAGLITALYPHFIFWTGYVLTEPLYLCFVAAALLTLIRVTKVPTVAGGITCGLLLASGVMVRVTLAPFAVAAPVWVVLFGAASVKQRFKSVLALVGMLAVVVGMWTGRNLVQLGSPVALHTSGGNVFYHGNSPGATGGSRGYVDDTDFVPLPVPTVLTEVEEDKYMWRAAFAFLREHPEAIPRLATRKLLNMFRPTYADASWLNSVVIGGSFVGLSVLFVVGLIRHRRLLLYALPVQLLLFFLIVQLIQHALVIGMIRFRLPCELVFAAVGSAALVSARSITDDYTPRSTH